MLFRSGKGGKKGGKKGYFYDDYYFYGSKGGKKGGKGYYGDDDDDGKGGKGGKKGGKKGYYFYDDYYFYGSKGAKKDFFEDKHDKYEKVCSSLTFCVVLSLLFDHTALKFLPNVSSNVLAFQYSYGHRER